MGTSQLSASPTNAASPGGDEKGKGPIPKQAKKGAPDAKGVKLELAEYKPVELKSTSSGESNLPKAKTSSADSLTKEGMKKSKNAKAQSPLSNDQVGQATSSTD